MTRIPLAPALIALFAASSAVAAEPGPAAAADESIVVEGHRAQTETIIRETINRAGVTPLARFEEKICPGIVGLKGDQAARLLQLLRDNVVALGGKLAAPGCTANATVIFVAQPVDFVRKLAVREPGYFDLPPRAIDRFTAKARPVVSWHVTETRGRDGSELGSSDKVADKKRKILNTQASLDVPMDATVNRNVAATRLYTNTREDMLFGFAVIDAAQLEGKTLTQLSDLATLHLLLDVKQDAKAANPASILSLFDERPEGAVAPPGLSQFDRAMVEGLYQPQENNRTAAQQFSQIATAIRRRGGAGR